MAWPLPSAAGPGCPRAELEGSLVFRPWQSSVLTVAKCLVFQSYLLFSTSGILLVSMLQKPRVETRCMFRGRESSPRVPGGAPSRRAAEVCP